jgi:hypothetical protein
MLTATGYASSSTRSHLIQANYSNRAQTTSPRTACMSRHFSGLRMATAWSHHLISSSPSGFTYCDSRSRRANSKNSASGGGKRRCAAS